MAKRDDEFTYDVSEDGATKIETSGNRRSKIISATVTGVLVVAGLAGGAAFAISRIQPGEQSNGSASSHGIASAGTGTQTPRPVVSRTSSVAKTIVVPPAPFEDKDGARKFHEQPASGAAQASTSATAAPSSSTPPTFGNGGDKGGDHNGDHNGDFNGDPNHHKDFNGVKPPHGGHDDGGFSLPSPAPTN